VLDQPKFYSLLKPRKGSDFALVKVRLRRVKTASLSRAVPNRLACCRSEGSRKSCGLPPLGCWQPVCSADVARSSNSYTSEGYVRSHRFQYGAAAKAFDEALKADPDDAQAYNGRGIVRMCTGQYAASIADYSSAIRLDPQWF